MEALQAVPLAGALPVASDQAGGGGKEPACRRATNTVLLPDFGGKRIPESLYP